MTGIGDEGPPASGFARRTALAAGLLVGVPLGVEADASGEPAFLRLSRILTGEPALDEDLARRLFRVAQALDPAFSTHAAALAALAVGQGDADALLARANAAGLRDTALAIVAAWFTGSVGSGVDAPVFAYAHALMFRAVEDAVPVPTYCAGRPGWWSAEPPPLGIPLRRDG